MRRAAPARRALAAGLAALLLPLAGCTGDDRTAGGDFGGDQELEKTSLTVGAVPVLGVAPLYIAIENGYFADEGLAVTAEVFPSGALSLPAMIGGELDLVFSSYIPFYLAQAQGAAQLQIVAESSASAPNSFGIYTMPDSPVQTLADLEGRKLAVNVTGALAELMAREALANTGVDASRVEFVEVPFPEIGAVLQRGDADAGFLAEPFITAASATLGVERLADVGVGTVDGLPIDGFGATEAWVKQHPNTAAAFQRAIQRAAETAGDNRAEVEKVITSYAKVDVTLAPLMAPLQYPTSINPTRLERVSDLMDAHGFYKDKEPVDVASMVGIPGT